MQVTRGLRGIVAVALFLLSVASAVTAKYSGGTGEANDPYRIATAADLIVLGETPGDYDKHFVLTADIDLDPKLPGRKVFDKAVIAPAGSSFTGLFDGKGHTILRLTIEGDRLLGLFGSLQSGAEVKNLGVVDVNITGSGQSVGGLVGYIEMGAVTGCYSSGSVSGPGSGVGGLVGDNRGSIAASYSSSEVSNSASGGFEGERAGGLVGSNSGSIGTSYSRGSVSGGMDAGGLVGYNGGTIAASYSTGAVSGIWLAFVGGLVGGQSRGGILHSFWDMETSGVSASGGGAGKTTAEMQRAKTFLNAYWDFVGESKNGTEDVWWIDEGKDYPRLWWEATGK